MFTMLNNFYNNNNNNNNNNKSRSTIRFLFSYKMMKQCSGSFPICLRTSNRHTRRMNWSATEFPYDHIIGFSDLLDLWITTIKNKKAYDPLCK